MRSSCWIPHEIIFSQRRPRKPRGKDVQATRREASSIWIGIVVAIRPISARSSVHEVRESHSALGRRLIAASGARRCKAAARRAWSCVDANPDRGRRRQVCHAQRADATLAGDGDVPSWPAGKGEKLSGRRDRVLKGSGTKEAGRQNKLQFLPLTRIAGRDSPKRLCMADLSARRQGKSLLRISRRTRTCRPASRRNECLGSACSCLTSPCFPLRGDLRSRSAHSGQAIARPPARYGALPNPSRLGVPGGLWWPVGFARQWTTSQAALALARELRGHDVVFSHLRACGRPFQRRAGGPSGHVGQHDGQTPQAEEGRVSRPAAQQHHPRAHDTRRALWKAPCLTGSESPVRGGVVGVLFLFYFCAP